MVREQLLTDEQGFLWNLARTWRDQQVAAPPVNIDWQEVVRIAINNKMPVLLATYLRKHGFWARLTPSAREQLETGEAIYREKAKSLSVVLDDYMRLADRANVPTIPLKGLWVSERIYGDPAMRPGHDLDILVRRSQIQQCVQLCESLTFDRYWPGLLPDKYYQRHHLHLELSLPDCWTWIEVHWAFDHPRTLLTIDYDAIFERATRADLLDAQIWEPAWPDVLLSLSIHLVKHAVFLPAVLDRPDLPQILLADGRLMHCMDIAEAIKQHGNEIDWLSLVRLTKEAGAEEIMGSVLRVCRDWLDAPVPESVLEALPLPAMSKLTKRLYIEMAKNLVAPEKSGRLWKFLVEPNWKFVFRPIRLLDYISYFAPPAEYLQRRYKRDTLPTRLFHSTRALFEYARLAFETVYYSQQVKKKSLAPDVELPEGSKCLEC